MESREFRVIRVFKEVKVVLVIVVLMVNPERMVLSSPTVQLVCPERKEILVSSV
jgi:hypothetical protein